MAYSFDVDDSTEIPDQNLRETVYASAALREEHEHIGASNEERSAAGIEEWRVIERQIPGDELAKYQLRSFGKKRPRVIEVHARLTVRVEKGRTTIGLEIAKPEQTRQCEHPF